MHRCVNGCQGLAWIGVTDRAVCPRCGGSVSRDNEIMQSLVDALGILRAQNDDTQNHYGPADVKRACESMRVIPREKVKITLGFSPEELDRLIEGALRTVGLSER